MGRGKLILQLFFRYRNLKVREPCALPWTPAAVGLCVCFCAASGRRRAVSQQSCTGAERFAVSAMC
jgi:hypothetical protein